MMVSSKIWNPKSASSNFTLRTKLSDLGIPTHAKFITGFYMNLFFGPKNVDEYGVEESEDFFLTVNIIKGNSVVSLCDIRNEDLARGGTSGGSYHFKKSLSDLGFYTNISLIDVQLHITGIPWPGNLYINDFGLEYSTKRKIPTKTHDED